MKNQFFATDPEMQSAETDLDRRTKLAAAIRSQALSPINPNVGYKISPWEGAAKLAQALVASQMDSDTDRQRQELSKKQMAQLSALLGGSPAPSEDSQPAISSSGEMLPAAPNAQPQQGQDVFGLQNLQKLKAIEMMGGTAAANAYMDQFKTPEKIKELQGYGIDPRSVADLVKGKMANESLVNIQQGGMAFDPLGGKVIASSPKLGEGIRLNANGEAVQIPGYAGANAGIEGAKAGAVSQAQGLYKPFAVDTPKGKFLTSETAAVQTGGIPLVTDTQKKTSGEIMSGLVDRVVKGSEKAAGAVRSLDSVSRIRQAMDTGNVNIGPGANITNVLGQIGNTFGITGKDSAEKLANTRQVIQGMAQLSLDAAAQMQGQGQLSNQERKLLENVSSGNIGDLTAPEVGKLMDIMDRASRYTINTHNANTAKLSETDPNAGQYFIQAPAPYKKPEPPQQMRPVQPQPSQSASQGTPTIKFRGFK